MALSIKRTGTILAVHTSSKQFIDFASVWKHGLTVKLERFGVKEKHFDNIMIGD